MANLGQHICNIVLLGQAEYKKPNWTFLELIIDLMLYPDLPKNKIYYIDLIIGYLIDASH